jgi:hypothetical protein
MNCSEQAGQLPVEMQARFDCLRVLTCEGEVKTLERLINVCNTVGQDRTSACHGVG